MFLFPCGSKNVMKKELEIYNTASKIKGYILLNSQPFKTQLAAPRVPRTPGSETLA
jgi:hypothetical protein